MLPCDWFELLRDYTWPIALGMLHTNIGFKHFLMGTEHASIVPPKGTWAHVMLLCAHHSTILISNYAILHCWLEDQGIG